jgi:hypothetical protein
MTKNINIEGVQIIGVPYVTSTKNPLDEEKTKQLLNEKVFDKNIPSISDQARTYLYTNHG